MSLHLSELRDLVRAEVGISGLQEYETLIDSIINQELQTLTGKAKYCELEMVMVFTSSIDGMFQFDLPADFQLMGSIDYKRPISDPDFNCVLSPGSKDLWLTKLMGYPQYFRRVGSQIWMYPYTNILSGETFSLTYYKKPSLVLDSDVVPVPSLEKVIQQLAMGRMLRMTDTKRAQMATADGKQTWLETRAQDANN